MESARRENRSRSSRNYSYRLDSGKERVNEFHQVQPLQRQQHGQNPSSSWREKLVFVASSIALAIVVIILMDTILVGMMSEAGSALFAKAQEDSSSIQMGQPPVLPNNIQYSSIPPVELRPKVVVNLHDWANRISDDIRAVNNRVSCVQSIRRSYDEVAKLHQVTPSILRDNVLLQINDLLSQHRSAVSSIVNESENLAFRHNFVKNLTINYTDVHRIRNELDSVQLVVDQTTGQTVPQQQQDSTGPLGSLGSSSGASGGVPQFTSIGGGTPVPGPPEWQTPIKSIIMRVNKNFGDIPVNTSMSAVHLPLPIYPGQPEIMNGIAWTEKLDQVFKRNLITYAHVHHQYYGDRLGFLRTFPAHKWRIPRLDPDLFDARTRPWYVAGSSSPKNVVILIDSSGSMTGLRREIAKGVVFEILDTLTSSDYFTVMRFSESITPIGLPKCSSNLKQAKLTPAIREQCARYFEALRLGVDTKNQAGSPAADHECLIFHHQTERSSQYLRDHPDVDLGKNGSYITDDAYEKSIANVTNEIRDAYMLPATSRNIRYLKSNFSMPTAGIANFTNALMGAFELLQAYERTSEMGSQCNQAIMLITDGAIRSHEEVFNRYNYPKATVRLFTYVIGREVGDIRPTKAMACMNRGYYTHVINLSEVREQVLKYLGVMARPLVLAKHHPVSWTPAYGDETHQVLTDWVLEIKRRERARSMLIEERDRERMTEVSVNIELTNIQEYDDIPFVDEILRTRTICEDNYDEGVLEQALQDELDPLGYNELACHWGSRRADLLTSVVQPVFDIRNTSLIFEPVLQKNIPIDKEVLVRNAQLLGVAAVDLRIADILKSIPSYQLGPNGYAILIGQNGFIMHHPDLRALLEDPFDKQSKILKPYFNAVDLTHIEQVFIRGESLESASNINRIWNMSRPEMSKLMKLRDYAIRGQTGYEQFSVKRAIDCRRRPHVRLQNFYYGPVKDTPFSLIIALPSNYGLNRINATSELKPKKTSRFFKPSPFELWTVHPDYKYCEGSGLINKDNSSVAKILEILELVDNGLLSEPRMEDLNSIRINKAASNSNISCDSELFPALLFDAAATASNWPDAFCGRSVSDDENCYKSNSGYFFSKSPFESNNEDLCNKDPDEMRSKLANIYGLEMSFLATRSGLTRVRVYDLSIRIKKLADLFIQRHNKALDESWYSRAVDWNMRSNNEDTIIITAPYNGYIRLVAKLRQRITQRQPSANNNGTNCDEEVQGQGSTDESTDAAFSTQTSTDPLENTRIEQADAMQAIISPPSNDALMQNDDPVPLADGSSSPPTSEPTNQLDSTAVPKFDYSASSSYDFLDLLTNSSVHIWATQSVIVGSSSGKRTPVAVAGLLYDYATFARRFLNATSLNIRNLDKESGTDQINGQQIKVDICPDGDCPTKCGFRNDTIDCMLVDNNGFIVVGEELPYIGRSLSVYDERLMQKLVATHVFNQITIIDYQAICARSAEQVAADQRAAAAASNPMPMQQSSAGKSPISLVGLKLITSFLANLANSFTYTLSALYSLLLYKTSLEDIKSAWGESGELSHLLVDAQSSTANQSVLALLPNKTYLRACEKIVTLYELRMAPSDKQKSEYSSSGSTQQNQKRSSNQAPEYYETKCNCSAWYVYEQVPKTNLIMLIVNTTSACRRCEQTNYDFSANSVPLNFAATNLPTMDSTGFPIPPGSLAPLGSGNFTTITSTPANRSAEEQVCAMLERDSNLFVQRTPSSSCYSYNDKEAEITLCGGGASLLVSNLLLAISTVFWILKPFFARSLQ